MHVIQQAFVESGAIQCGYCTPAQVLAAKQLLESNPSPTEAEVRDALSGVLCRCTGYLKPVQAVLLAAAILRGEKPEHLHEPGIPAQFEPNVVSGGEELNEPPFSPAVSEQMNTQVRLMPRVFVTPESRLWQRVGKPEIKVDAVKVSSRETRFCCGF